MNGGLWLKNKICKIGILAFSLTLFSGCGVENFFEIQSAMSPPKLSENQESVRVLIKNYFQKEICWIYPKFEEKYSSVIDFSVSSANKNFKIAFCKVAEEKYMVHVIFIEHSENKYEIFKDISICSTDICEVDIIDADGDKDKELIISAEDFEGIYTLVYKLSNDDISQINLSETQLKNLNNVLNGGF